MCIWCHRQLNEHNYKTRIVTVGTYLIVTALAEVRDTKDLDETQINGPPLTPISRASRPTFRDPPRAKNQFGI